MKTYTAPMLGAATPVMNVNITTPAFQLKEVWGYAVQVVVTGTPTGTFSLQGSCDQMATVAAPTNWTTISSSSQAVSAAGSFMWDITDVTYNWVRLLYVDGSSGASTAVLRVCTLNTKAV